MKIWFCGYRGWALEVLHMLEASFPEHFFDHINDKVALETAARGQNAWFDKPDLVLCCGWSWIIPPDVLTIAPFIGMHPSKLPDFAGGSPLQHQILAGLDSTEATLFEITSELDAGGIIDSEPFSLKGNMSDVLSNMTDASFAVFNRFIDKFPNYTTRPQTPTKPLKRIKPEASRLTPEMLQTMTTKQLYDFIRCREDPYPNAYIEDETGKLYFKLVKFE